MPKETQQAVNWALRQKVEVIEGIFVYTKDPETGEVNSEYLVDFTRQYFNENNIEYSTFDFNSLKPYI